MAKTTSLNSGDTVYVATYYGGFGRSYDFTIVKDGVKVNKSLTEDDLFSLLAGLPGSTVIIDDTVRPEFDR